MTKITINFKKGLRATPERIEEFLKKYKGSKLVKTIRFKDHDRLILETED